MSVIVLSFQIAADPNHRDFVEPRAAGSLKNIVSIGFSNFQRVFLFIKLSVVKKKHHLTYKGNLNWIGLFSFFKYM